MQVTMASKLNIDPDWPKVFLKQGEFFISNGIPVVVSTVLGSCVSVTFHCPRLGIGGITHAVFPGSEFLSSSSSRTQGNFVRESINCVLEQMCASGAGRDELQIKVFGGAQMYASGMTLDAEQKSVGRRNVESALYTLQKLGLRIMVTEVGGSVGRKLIFFPKLGDVWVKKLNSRKDPSR